MKLQICMIMTFAVLESVEMIKEYIVRKKVGKKGRVFATKEVGELVHCEDCKHKAYCSQAVDMTVPYFRTATFESIDYCSYGEREESGTEQ